MAPAKGRAKLFQDAEDRVAKDYDPESNAPEQGGSDSDESQDEAFGTEHYVDVGKSKLRQNHGVSLGPQYQGAKVSRVALEDESEGFSDEDNDEDDSEDDANSYDDPDAADLAADAAEASDSEIESDNALADSDSERFKTFAFRGSSKPAKPASKLGQRAAAADYMQSSDDESATGARLEDDTEGDESEDDGLDDSVNGAVESEESDSEGDYDEATQESSGDSEDNEDSSAKKPALASRPNLANLSARPDVEKGVAIRQQRKTYDGLLNLRIRLQKALIAVNTFPTLDSGASDDTQPYEAAEEAAVRLLGTIDDIRHNFRSSQDIGKKRKRIEQSMGNDEIWAHLQGNETLQARNRQAVLDKWSRKVQNSSQGQGDRLSSVQKPLVEVLQEQLALPDNRLVKRSKTPRSCAPAQASKKRSEDPEIYDDADFYQLLLKELVDQRTVETASSQNTVVPTVMLAAAKDAKVRKVVDRKASKGRKMRFTIHEKLQNFMAPEDRTTWEPEAIDRFFGTLFGQKMELNEEESADEDMEDLDAAEEGIQLFKA